MKPTWKQRTLQLANANISYEKQSENALVLQQMIQLKNDLATQGIDYSDHVQKHIDKLVKQSQQIDIPASYQNLFKQRVQNDLINNRKLVQSLIGQDNDWLKSWQVNESLQKPVEQVDKKEEKKPVPAAPAAPLAPAEEQKQADPSQILSK